MRNLWIILPIWTTFILLAIGFRALSAEMKKNDVAQLMAKELKTEIACFEVETYNYLRGDYRVSLKKPPFQEISWTVNLLTKQIFSWQPKTKEDSILRSLL